MSDKKRLIILDSNALLHRAFHALPPLTNSKGQPTGAVYGFLLTLFKAIQDVGATHVVATFDTPKPTFRHKAFQAYKAHRTETPSDIISQIALTKTVLEALGIPLFALEGFEADDLVATIAEKSKSEAMVFIVSGDLDNLQLVDENVKVYTLGKGIKDSIIYDAAKVVERFGVLPSQMNDFKALTGDPSDNVPGVMGIGKTIATRLISEYHSIENLYSELSTDTAILKPKIKEALRAHKADAFLSLDLVTTKRDVPIDFQINDCQFGTFDQKKVEALWRELGFMSLLDRLATFTKTTNS